MSTLTDFLLRRAVSEEEAIRRLQAKCQPLVRAQIGRVMSLGIAYLWFRRYEEAWCHFDEVSRKHMRRGDIFYGFAGVAKWCLGDVSKAVACWQAGLKAGYRRANGVTMPMLLYWAAIVRPGSFDRARAEALMLERISNVRGKVWPGPVAAYLIGQIDHATLEEVANEDGGGTKINLPWLVSFYDALVERESEGPERFAARMRACADTRSRSSDFQEAFPNRLVQEEFYLDRYEGGN